MQIITTASLLVLVTAASTFTADAREAAGGNHSVSLSSGPDWCPWQEYHVDYPGNDIATYPQTDNDACCDLCLLTGNCGAYTWTTYEGGSCYLKTKKTTTLWKGPNPDGSANTISADVYRCDSLIKDIDFDGENLATYLEDRPENCCTLCSNSRLCFGFSWSSYNGGTCWLKGEHSLRVKSNPGVYSAYRYKRN